MKKLKNPEDLPRLFEGLSKDLVDAHAYRDLRKDLLRSLTPEIHGLANTFWYMTLNALQQTWGAALCRLFDTEPNSLSLRTLLQSIAENLSEFEDFAFRQRLSGNPHATTLAFSRKIPDLKQIEADIEICNPKNNHLIKKLIKIRSQRIAHRGFSLTASGGDIPKEYWLIESEIDELLSLAKEIMNRYSYTFDASTYATKIHAQNDFGEIIIAAKDRVRKYEIEFGLDSVDEGECPGLK